MGKYAIALAILLCAATARADEIRDVIDAELAWMESRPVQYNPMPTSLADIKVAPKIFAPDAAFSLPHAELIRGPAQLFAELFVACASPSKHELKDWSATQSGDGKTAWVSFSVSFGKLGTCKWWDATWRVSEVLANDGGWKIVAGAWSVGEPNADVNSEASAGHLEPIAIAEKTSGDASALADLIAKGIPSPRKDLIVFGSAPGERTTAGKPFAAAWKAGWVGKVTIEGATVSGPSWTIANLVLAKKGYKIPFRAFLVFDNGSLAHLHLAATTMQLGYDEGATGCSPEVAARIRRRLLVYDRDGTPKGTLMCTAGKFRKVKDILPGIYVELDAISDHADRYTINQVLSTDGEMIIHINNVKHGTPIGPEYEETREAIDLDGDGADEILVLAHASARADIHGVYVIPVPFDATNFVKIAVDLRPKELPGYCEATLSRQRAGKETHIVINVTKVVPEVDCLAKGRHVFAFDAKASKLVER
jgi:hypothetical protein